VAWQYLTLGVYGSEFTLTLWTGREGCPTSSVTMKS